VGLSFLEMTGLALLGWVIFFLAVGWVVDRLPVD
jgi:hypothetical protein